MYNLKISKKINVYILFGTLLLSILLSLLLAKNVNAAPSVTITSPTPNQSVPGTSFTVRGTASPNTTIVVSANDVSLAQTKSDSSGNWSINSTLPAGNINLRAKAIQNPEYGYFPSTPDLQNYKINRIRLSDNAINPGGGSWPITSTAEAIMLLPSTKSNFMYYANPFIANSGTGKFIPGIAADATPVSGYPAGAFTNKGAFSADDSKFYSVNGQLTSVEVIDTSTNSIIDSIELGSNQVTAWEGTNDKLYVILFNNQIKIINTDTDTVEKTLTIPCVAPNSTATMTFSKDKNYPFYYVPCSGDGTLLKYKVSDDTLVDTFNVGLSPQSGALSLDNKRLFLTSRFGTPNSDKFKVINTSDGSEIITKDLTAGALGFISTDDFQKIYITTPGNNVDTANIDVMDTTSYEITPVTPPEIAGAITFLSTESSEASMQVAFVLGASSPSPLSGALAETGISSLIPIVLLAIFTTTTFYLYIDYRKHKKPLTTIDPEIHYTFIHHVKMVNLPMLKYRITSKFHNKHYTSISK